VSNTLKKEKEGIPVASGRPTERKGDVILSQKAQQQNPPPRREIEKRRRRLTNDI